jgi:glycosyltransferase involved in cell wall biosynthesis
VIDAATVSLSDIRRSLLAVDRLIVHQQADADNLARFGITENVALIEQGTPQAPTVSRSQVRKAMGLDQLPVVATFGFLLPHKGTLSLIEMLDHLRDEIPDLQVLALTALHPDPLSTEYEKAVREEISRRDLDDRVRIITEYLPDDLARTMLSAADVIVLPYRETPESSSAAARFVLPAGRPVIASDLPIFADAREAIYTYPPGDQHALEQAVTKVLADPVLANSLANNALTRASRARWGLAAAAHADVYRAAREAGRRRRGRPMRSVTPMRPP